MPSGWSWSVGASKEQLPKLLSRTPHFTEWSTCASKAQSVIFFKDGITWFYYKNNRNTIMELKKILQDSLREDHNLSTPLPSPVRHRTPAAGPGSVLLRTNRPSNDLLTSTGYLEHCLIVRSKKQLPQSITTPIMQASQYRLHRQWTHHLRTPNGCNSTC